MKISIMGAGYVGLASSVAFAAYGHEVLVFERDKDRIMALREGQCPIYEPGMEQELQRRMGSGALSFHHVDELRLFKEGIDAFVIAVGTPSAPDGGADLSFVRQAALDIAVFLRNHHTYTLVVVKSTVPVGTQRCVLKWLREGGADTGLFDVVSCPEFLREGTALHDALHPHKVVIGTDSPRAAEMAKKIYERFPCPLIITDPIETSCEIRAAGFIELRLVTFYGVQNEHYGHPGWR